MEPSLNLESSTSEKSVPVMPTPTREEVNDDDHETSDQVTTKPHRSTRVRSAPEWYGNPVLEVMLLDHDDVTSQIFNLECYTLDHQCISYFICILVDPRNSTQLNDPTERVGDFVIFTFEFSQILGIGSFDFIYFINNNFYYKNMREAIK